MTMQDCRGVPLSCNDGNLISTFEECLIKSNDFTGAPMAKMDRLLKEHPDFIMGHVFKASMLTQSMEVRIYPEMVASVEAAEDLIGHANDRERGHIAALQSWINGDFFGAVQHWETVLVQYPFDLLALQLVHLTDVLLGDTVGQRDCVARVFSLWDESVPGYEFVLGFYSFGLEENRDFAYAEELGRRAVSIRPGHPYAIHAVAHVMEMKGRQSGGIWWMNSHLDDWQHSHFANHLWWHLSLFHLDLCQEDQVLHLYDNHLRASQQDGNRYEELDACALLWRLKLLGVDVGNRWVNLADKWEPSATDTLYAFNDIHAMMAFVSDSRTEAASSLRNANERHIDQGHDANVAMTRHMGLPFCNSLEKFSAGDYAGCVDELLPVRYRTWRLGGSFAQRDVIGWTLLEAALRAGRFKLALALANERCAMKPTSPQNWRMAARAHDGLGDQNRHARCAARAESLLAA